MLVFKKEVYKLDVKIKEIGDIINVTYTSIYDEGCCSGDPYTIDIEYGDTIDPIVDFVNKYFDIEIDADTAMDAINDWLNDFLTIEQLKQLEIEISLLEIEYL